MGLLSIYWGRVLNRVISTGQGMSNVRKVAIFDWDGTLSDSCATIIDCLHRASIETGLVELTRHEYAQIIGLGLDEAISALYPQAGGFERDQMASAYRRHHAAAVEKEPPAFFDGAHQLLASLKSEGFLLAVSTGKSRAGLDRALKASGVADYFAITRCANETASKPNPRMLFEILSELDVSPTHAFMVGDTVFDLEMARRADVASIGITHGVHSREQMAAAAPVVIVDHLSHVLPAALEIIA